ncbi:MAG: hypothetical protein HC886_13845 [Leptolyngbyaceae cyanobacterium SM1_1_3]|nr:hypothetical protein [Leptolyngbyaceae cyanobacterium SM1_1_3]NJM84832.1 hypothetical protein [Leptolyngbyaceae cyanobacterium RM2_2_21]NJN03640.1 hypothetical protein [Leptolyngbyaceae cyanobacterium RM1_1_2]NJO10098.1 hypothetical protein [Leptolyngbyaceae cyanobacterium SL_1_1]
MSDRKLTQPENPSEDLRVLAQQVQQAAQRRQEDCIALLALLRLLEGLHQDIRETLFSEALPNNRQKLYSLLRDIEGSGGWPYIQRMKLRSLYQQMEALEEIQEQSTNHTSVD